MLLDMLTDEKCHIRTLTALRIIRAREIGPEGNCSRIFVIPAVNFGAADYAQIAKKVAESEPFRYLADRFNPSHGNLCDNPLPLLTTRFQNLLDKLSLLSGLVF
ncbi:hypothetical protein AVEN_122558-1 [Araneus ventricosus]|uniref:Uncharacterized protein n=1 Tax=Araneus ventricosus TaxID=182803 RepID=A0A4Y2IQ45_ARAVE|nr:hypothetical protein AVEN_122558-1 [Araneus ventricosus]